MVNKLLAKLAADVKAREQRLDDPRKNGSGEDAVSPTGDDYNDLLSDVEDALRRIEEARKDPGYFEEEWLEIEVSAKGADDWNGMGETFGTISQARQEMNRKIQRCFEYRIVEVTITRRVLTPEEVKA